MSRRVLLSYLAFFLILGIFVIAPMAIVLQVVLGNPFTQFVAGGICEGDSLWSSLTGSKESQYCIAYQDIQKQLGAKEVAKLQSQLQPGIAAALDCTNVTPQARANHECIPGLMETVDEAAAREPIPPRAQWLVPIWQAAAQKYDIPWELLAAVNGARTDFGLFDCTQNANDQGAGFYRQPDFGGYLKYSTHAGQATDTPNGANCTTSAPPYHVSSSVQNYGANIYDAVDASYTEARMLAANGATGSVWNYNGIPDTGAAGAGSSAVLTSGQQEFSTKLSQLSGLNVQVIEAWCLAEESGTAAQIRQVQSNNDWLNIGYTSSGPDSLTGNSGWKTPDGGAELTYEFLDGTWGGASSGIRSILSSSSSDETAQVDAIRSSGWAGSSMPANYITGELPLITGSAASSLGSTPPQTLPATLFSDGPVFYPPSSSTYTASGTSAAIPPGAQWLIPVYQAAAQQYHVPWELLAAINDIETGFGQNLSVSSAGAVGWMQFEPSTWAVYGVSAGGVPGGNNCQQIPAGAKPYFTTPTQGGSPCNPVDAIFAAANYLAASGAKNQTTWNFQPSCSDPISQAVYAYNHNCSSIATDVSAQLGCAGYVTCVHAEYAQIVAQESGGQGSSQQQSASSPINSSATPPMPTSSCSVPAQTDAVSKAVAYNGAHPAMSPCYVDVVHAWYQAIELNPQSFDAGSGGSIVQIAESQIGQGPNPKYWYFAPSEYAAYGTTEWCAAFASWVWHSANVPGFTGTASAGSIVVWGLQHNLAHPVGSGYIPQPGDAIVYDYSNGYAAHVGIVEQVLANGDVITIEGNYAGQVARVGPFNPTQPRPGDGLQASYYVSPGVYPASSGSSGSGGGTA